MKQAAPCFIFTHHDELPWIPSKFAEGVAVKNLGKSNGRAMQLVRFQSGASFPAHLHTDVEFLFMLEGEVLQNGKKLTPGWSTVAPAGTEDFEFISPTGCTFLLMYSLKTSDLFNLKP